MKRPCALCGADLVEVPPTLCPACGRLTWPWAPERPTGPTLEDAIRAVEVLGPALLKRGERLADGLLEALAFSLCQAAGILREEATRAARWGFRLPAPAAAEAPAGASTTDAGEGTGDPRPGGPGEAAKGVGTGDILAGPREPAAEVDLAEGSIEEPRTGDPRPVPGEEDTKDVSTADTLADPREAAAEVDCGEVPSSRPPR